MIPVIASAAKQSRATHEPPDQQPLFASAAPRNDRGKHPAVYLMASQRNGTLYVGVTSNLVRRVAQHRAGALPGFTSSHACKLLVWYEPHEDMTAAILREKQIKGGSRKKKLALIETDNPLWRDLYEDIL